MIYLSYERTDDQYYSRDAYLDVLGTYCAVTRGAGSLANEISEEPIWVPLMLGTQRIEVKIAETPEARSWGLMHEKFLDESSRILFVFESPRQARFWMKDTEIPLDIGFFDVEGVLLEVLPMEPFSEKLVQSSSDEVSYALEMNQGYFDKHGICVGVKLDLCLD